MENERELAPQIAISEARAKNPKLLIQMILREGKTFKASAIASGYAESVACRGLKALMAESSSVAEAYQAEINSLASSKLGSLKAHVIRRLEASILNLKSVDGMKACELAGRFKETDWWVKSSADVQIGILAGLAAEPAILPAEPYKDDE